jgi:hypothetical protein
MRVWNSTSHITGRKRTELIQKQSADENVWTQEDYDNRRTEKTVRRGANNDLVENKIQTDLFAVMFKGLA